MKIDSDNLKGQELNERDMILFEKGLIGLPELKRFIVMDFEEESPLHWLQSIDNPNIGFIVANPIMFAPNYLVTLEPGAKKYLRIDNDDEMVVMVIVTVKDKGRLVTGNLLGPIVVNASKRLACQIALEQSGFGTEQPLRDIRDIEKADADTRSGVTV